MGYDFNALRLRAMLATPSDPVRLEVTEEQWANFGRLVWDRTMDEPFRKAVVTMLLQAEGASNPQQAFVERLRTYLVTGIVPNAPDRRK